ncbi:hypothetical protein RHS04_03486 [Rhizoctonia solani]|uniref:Uncharacterized protein n=1 Tax=Rhizoctonia solani TaxID=456999 RepID=A0A8H7HCA0_9AGAM|nr:hypothetical protein RHS04_03486 [Rhizoctonia solani]
MANHGVQSPYLCERLRDENQTTDEAPSVCYLKGSSIEYHVPVTPYPLVLLASSPAERSQQRWNPENRISSTLSPTAELEVAPLSITSLRGAQHTPSYLILASAIEMQGLYHTSGVHGGDSLCEQLSTRAKNNQLKRSTQSDLWHEAYSIKDGCSFVQYVDGPEYHIRYPGRDSRRTAMTYEVHAIMRWSRSQTTYGPSPLAALYYSHINIPLMKHKTSA